MSQFLEGMLLRFIELAVFVVIAFVMVIGPNLCRRIVWLFTKTRFPWLFLFFFVVPLYAQIVIHYGGTGGGATPPAGCSTAPTYFGSAVGSADSGTVAGPGPQAISPPANMLRGDLVVISANYRGDAALTMSVNGGQMWTEEKNSRGSTNIVRGGTFWCTFNGTWAADPSVTNTSGTLALSSQMQVFRPCDTTHMWGIDATMDTARWAAPSTPFTVTIPAKTTAHNNAIIWAQWQSNDDDSWTGLTANWVNPGPAYTGLQNLSGSDESQFVAYRILAAAGSGGNVAANQSTKGGDDGCYNTVSFYDSAAGATPYYVGSAVGANDVTATSVSCDKPVGTADGDMLIACFALESVSETITFTGWTEFTGSPVTNTTLLRAHFYYKRASSEGSSYTASWSGSHWTQMTIITLRHMLASGDPLDQLTSTASTGTTITIPTMTPSVTGTMAIMFANNQSGGAFTTKPATNVQSTNFVSLSYQYLPSTSATGTRVFVNSSDDYIGLMFNLKPQ